MQVFYIQSGPRKLTKPNAKSSGMGEILDLLYYILDLSSTINRLLSVYPEARQIFFNANFHLTQVC